MKEITTGMVCRAATSTAQLFRLDPADFDAWMADHDQGIRDEALEEVMHEQWPTPQQLIGAAWDRAYEVPEGRTIPAGMPHLRHFLTGSIDYRPQGSEVPLGDGVRHPASPVVA